MYFCVYFLLVVSPWPFAHNVCIIGPRVMYSGEGAYGRGPDLWRVRPGRVRSHSQSGVRKTSAPSPSPPPSPTPRVPPPSPSPLTPTLTVYFLFIPLLYFTSVLKGRAQGQPGVKTTVWGREHMHSLTLITPSHAPSSALWTRILHSHTHSHTTSQPRWPSSRLN